MTHDLRGLLFRAEVVRIENYGIYFKFDYGQALVLITDLPPGRVLEGPALYRGRDLQFEYHVGDVATVCIEKYVEQNDVFKAVMTFLRS